MSKWRKSKPSTHLKTPEKRTGVQIHAHTHTRTYRDILLPDEVYLCCSQARREGEVELSDAAIRTTLSGLANKNEYFSPEISMGTYGGGLAHLQAHTHTHIHRQIHSLSWLPELFTSQSQMPQLSHQYRCVNDANCYAHWTIVQGLQCEHKYGSVAVLVCSWSLLLYENRCNEHPSLAACQETAQLAEQRSSLNLPQFLLSPRLPSLWLPFSPPLPDWKYSPPSVTSLVSSAFLNGALLQDLCCAHSLHSTHTRTSLVH